MPGLRRSAASGALTRPVGVALACLLALLAIACVGAASANAAVTCPNANPVVNENQCKTGSSSWQVFDYSKDLGGYTTKTSVDLGEDVALKIGRDAPVAPTRTVNIDVYRMGYYGGQGARLVKSATNVAINNDFTCKAMDQVTGEVDCGNWAVTYTIPGSSLPASGIYLAKLTASTGDQTQVVFTVRDDDSSAKALFVLPIANYQAYNTFGGKSLYFGNLEGDTVGSPTPATGTDRAAKVSFNRPFNQAGAMQNWFFGPDYDLLFWMEKQGYDVSYTDEVAIHNNPGQLLDHDVDVVSGHSEYWSLEEFNGFKAARTAGVNIASFGANNAYWKVRYENGGRTLVCYKTVQGSGTEGNGTVSQNDWGPDGLKGTADDALGLDGKAGTADDKPQNSTTTFRDNGAPEGDPNAPPGGRVGPDMPENELWGVLYMGDDDAFSWPLTVPPTNGQSEFSGDRIWRNAGLPTNATSKIGTRIVNWEWDVVPTQAQYLAHQPANVVKLSATAIEGGSALTNWLIDEGRARTFGPPPGQPNTVNAVKYKAPSGALVFAAGTMLWSHGLSNEAQQPIEQATYNIFSDMGVQPATPEENIVLDPGGSNQAPNASFTLSPNPVKTATTVTFNGAASSDPNGTVAKYEWDLDGDGSYETNTGTKSSTTRSYSLEGDYAVRLRVTDNGGATDFATRTLTVINNQPPTAAFTSSPSSPVTGEAVSFNGSGSKDVDGTIAKYEWDLDGNGSYETNTGASPNASRTYTAAGDVNVKLRVTDNGGKQATAEATISVASNGVSNYSPTVMATPGLAHYWRLNETAGTKFADSAGSSPATIVGAPTLGVVGGVPSDADKAARFKGLPDAASAEVNLSGTPAITVEFWLKWSAYANDDKMALEFTKNFNDIAGGFLVDPNAPQLGGTFGVGIGQGTTRNNVFFNRPTAGVWHHYAFAIDTGAPAAQAIVPYVDGQPIAYTKLDSGSGGGFANSTLSFMSRATSSYFGVGDLDEVAIYERALSAQEVDEHFNSDSGNKRPQASFTAPATAKAGVPVAFDASASKDPDGTIAKYEWDLDGNGSYETDTGTTATASRTYTANGNVKVGLRVTDNSGTTGVAFRTVAIEGAEEPEPEEKVSNYSPTVLSTPGLMHYWRLNETAGTSFADSVGGVPATTSGGPTLGVAGGVPNDTDKAARFDGANDSASAAINLAGKTAVTVEFWMKWNAWGTDDDLAMEFTPNFNDNAGGFLVDPNAPQLGGSFGIGIGAGTARNNAFFTRPSAGAWHHYAFVLNTQAPASEQIVPYVDGKAVAYTKLNSGTGAVPFVKSTLYMMSRAGSFLNGAGDLDEVAIYDRALGAATIDEHFNSESGNKRPLPSFGFAPAAPKVGETVSFDAAESKDPDGTIAKYEWDLDGNGSYETATGTTPSATQAYSQTGVVKVGLRVTDNSGASSTTTRAVTVEAQPGPEEVAGYAESVLGTAGLVDYWRLGEPSGSVFADAVGANNATISGNPVLGVAGGVPHDSDRAARFDGVDDAASAPVSLGGKTAATVEFWLKAESWNNNDDLALELTNNFNSAPGGFIVDPNSSYGSFAVGIGIGASRNVSVFPRPSTGVWHHYAFVLNTQAAAAEQVIPYVDGQPVGYTKVESGSGAPAFADAALNFMSRAETNELNAAGDLDEVALFDRALSAATIANHFAGHVDNKRPVAVLQAPASAQVGQTVNFSAAGSSDPDGTIAKYEWDLDGNGSYETDTGTTPSASRSYPSPTTLKVALRVTDNGGSAASASRLLSIEGEEPVEEEEPETPPAGPSYAEGVGATPGLIDFWRLGESSGSTFADSVGANTATIAGAPTLGIASAVPGDSDKAASFDGDDDAASAAVTGLAGKTAATVEFWMKWDSYDSDDDLAMEFTNNFNDNAGGFLVDPDSGYGSFAVGLGIGASRNVSLFARPSIGTWHHYAFVLDTQAAAAQQVVPYVDGQPVAYTKAATGTGAPAFASAALSFMSRAASSLNGAGDLDEVALYDRALSPKTVADHFALAASNTAPEASFTASPNPAPTGSTVSFNAAGSKDSDGTIAKYEWDLDGNGSYETDGGASPSTSRAYASPGTRTVALRVTDDDGAKATTTRSLTIENTAPSASFTVSPSPVQTGKAVSLDAAASSDADGTVAKYEWDLDGNGSYETDGGASATTTTSYAAIGQRTIGLRVTDGNGATGTTTRSLTVLNSPPTAAFTATPNPAPTGTAVGFDAAGSSDSDGTIAKYEWDLDGNGSYETNTGAAATTTKAFASAGERTIGLRITDNNGGTATATQTVTTTNRAPSASFTTTPSTAQSGVAISFNGGGSTDPDGTVIKYQWDFDGNGTYETDAGGVATTAKAFTSTGTKTVGLQVTDNSGATATTTRTVTITNAAPIAAFSASPNPAPTGTTVSYNAAGSSDVEGPLAKYEWDLDGNGTYETSTGTTAAAASSYATTGARTVRLRVTDSAGATAIASVSVTITNRAPEASFTVTPNPVVSGSNTVLNASASKDPDGTIAKYEWDLDGNGSYEVNAGSTASTTRSFSVAGERTVGLRVTDNLGATATTTRVVNVSNRAPTASFTVSPSSAATGATVTLNGSGSSDPDGTLAKYEWDFDNNGTYDATTATSSTTTTYATAGGRTIVLRVTDNLGATATTTRTVTITNRAPTAAFTTSPNPILAGANITFNASSSVDPDGTIAKYEWDFDNNGTYEVNGGTAPTTVKSFSPAGDRTIRLRVTDNSGAATVDTETLSVRGSYNNAVLSSAGLIDYWRLGETSGSTLANSVSGAPSATRGGATQGVAGNLTLDGNTALSFDGSNDDAYASLNLSGTQVLTLEFWLKWTAFANNDDLAFEFTSNFNNSNGGFLVNPNSSTSSGRFEVALGRNGSRNNAYFTRPSANAWHHYAIVLNTAAAAASQITVYVDGAPVSIVKGSSGTGAGAFANSTLNFMSRNGSSLLSGTQYGAGTLDEVAIYSQALSAAQVSQHYAAK